MLPPDVKITKQTEDAQFTADGKVVPQIRVVFLVGDHGPFVERFAKDGFTADLRDQKLTAWAREVRTT